MATFPYATQNSMPTVTNWDIIPEFNTFVSEFGSGVLVRNSKWTVPRYKFKIKYRTPMRKEDINAIKDFYLARKGMFESFLLYVQPLGTTHTVLFTSDTTNYNYWFNTLSNTGEVSFQEVV